MAARSRMPSPGDCRCADPCRSGRAGVLQCLGFASLPSPAPLDNEFRLPQSRRPARWEAIFEFFGQLIQMPVTGVTALR